MAKELYVGSLSYDTTEDDLKKVFSVSGTVTSVHIITDPQTGWSKGCGYVRMSSEAEAKDAIESLDGAIFMERHITVSMAVPQKHTTPGGNKGKGRGPARGPGGFKRDGSSAPKSGSFAPKSGGSSAPKSGGSSAPKSGGSSAPKSGAFSAPKSGAFSAPKPGGASAAKPGRSSATKSGRSSAPKSGKK